MVTRFNSTLLFVALTGAGSLAFGQNAVRGFPEATRVYYNGNTMAAPSYGGYAPAPHAAGYLPATGVTAYHPGAIQQPTTAYYAPQPVAAAAPVITAPPASRVETQAYPPSPFYRAPSNYIPPNYVYRPGAQPTAVTYYRPVTVYDPVTGAPATYMSACTGTECRGAPQRTYFAGKAPCNGGGCNGGSCATGNCGAPAVPYYGAQPPVMVQPQIVQPAPQVIPTVPSAPPNFGQPPVYAPPPVVTAPPINTAPPAAVYPSYPAPIQQQQPPAATPWFPAPGRTTVPPPATNFPQSQPMVNPGAGTFSAPPSNFGMPSGTGIGGADPRANVAPNLSPGTFQPGTIQGGGNYPPQTDPKLGTPTRVEPGKNGEPPTYYYYRGSGTAAAQQQPSQQQTQPMQPPAQQQPMQQQPMQQQPQYNGPALNNPQQNGGTSTVIPPLNNFGTGTTQQQPEPFRFRASGIDSPAANTVPQPPLQFPVHPEVKPLPDPEPRPVNRAPQLLNPKDKTAMRNS